MLGGTRKYFKCCGSSLSRIIRIKLVSLHTDYDLVGSPESFSLVVCRRAAGGCSMILFISTDGADAALISNTNKYSARIFECGSQSARWTGQTSTWPQSIASECNPDRNCLWIISRPLPIRPSRYKISSLGVFSDAQILYKARQRKNCNIVLLQAPPEMVQHLIVSR